MIDAKICAEWGTDTARECFQSSGEIGIRREASVGVMHADGASGCEYEHSGARHGRHLSILTRSGAQMSHGVLSRPWRRASSGPLRAPKRQGANVH